MLSIKDGQSAKLQLANEKPVKLQLFNGEPAELWRANGEPAKLQFNVWHSVPQAKDGGTVKHAYVQFTMCFYDMRGKEERFHLK